MTIGLLTQVFFTFVFNILLMTEQTYGGERGTELAGGLTGLVIGSCIAGPFGAAIGAAIGAHYGNKRDRRIKAEKG